MPVQLRVIIDENNIQKLKLPSGIPEKVEHLIFEIVQTFQLDWEFDLLYEDKDFENQYFTLSSTADLEDKATVKLVRKEPLITLDLYPVEESGASSTQSTLETCPANDGEVSNSLANVGEPSTSEAVLIPELCRSAPWPVPFQMPKFSRDIELILAEANKSYLACETHFNNASVKSAIMQDLAKAIFTYTAYPSSVQISSVAEALVQKYPCLKEPGSFGGIYGWQQRLKYKMHNFRAKLKSQNYTYPELEVNTLKRKLPRDAAPAKNVKRPRRAEVNYLPPYPVGENQDTLEKDRLELIDELKKKNNEKVIEEKMLRTFSIRRKEVVTISPAVSVFKERWPGLFCKAQVLVEFRRITTISLEETFMRNLDRYTPRLLQLMLARGGTSGTRMRPLLNTINEVQSIEKKRDILVCCLIEYLGENHEELFQDCQVGELERQPNQAMKVVVMHNPTAEQDPADVYIVIEGNKVLSGCGNRTTACILLMGLIYAMNLQYPRNLKYCFDVFQKLFLELDVTNPLKKVQTLKRKLME